MGNYFIIFPPCNQFFWMYQHLSSVVKKLIPVNLQLFYYSIGAEWVQLIYLNKIQLNHPNYYRIFK